MARNSQQPPKRFSIVSKELLEESPRHDAVLMASYGLAGNYIAKVTGIKRGAVYYACKKSGVRITDYRNGISNVSTIVRRLTQQKVDDELYKHLRNTL
jgi:hypothetical protein